MAFEAPRALAGEDPRVLAFLDAIAEAVAEAILRDLAPLRESQDRESAA